MSHTKTFKIEYQFEIGDEVMIRNRGFPQYGRIIGFSLKTIIGINITIEHIPAYIIKQHNYDNFFFEIEKEVTLFKNPIITIYLDEKQT